MTEAHELRYHEFAKLPAAAVAPRGTLFAETPDGLTVERLERAPRKELDLFAQCFSLSKSGSHADVVARVIGRLGVLRSVRGLDLDALQVLKGDRLRGLCRSLGAYAGQNKYALAVAIVNARAEFNRKLRSVVAHYRHEEAIAEAQRSGKTVPAAVLEDHPSLQAGPPPRTPRQLRLWRAA